jgi:hypothetical protein
MFRNYGLKATLANNLSHLLQAGNFLTGSLVFSQNSRITTEVFSTPSNREEFYVDYNNAIIYTATIPIGTVLFQYQQFPYFAKWSPVSINSFKDEEFLNLITEQVENENEIIENGIPTQDGAELINELLSVSPQYWGK